jgi:hypothetical protein
VGLLAAAIEKRVDPPVLLASFGDLVAGNRFVLAMAPGSDPLGLDIEI